MEQLHSHERREMLVKVVDRHLSCWLSIGVDWEFISGDKND